MALTAEEKQALQDRKEAGEELTQEEESSLTTDGKVEVNGVQYDQDAEGNFCINGIPVLDKDQVPWHNRGREVERVREESERKIAEANARHQAELNAARTPAPVEPNPEDIDPETGLTYGALKVIDKRNETKIKNAVNQERERNLNVNADTNISTQKHYLKEAPKYKAFFENPKYVAEMDGYLKKISLESAMLPNIVEQAVKLVIGEHYEELEKAAEKRAKEDLLQHREIVGEVKLGKSAGSSAGKRVTVTPEIVDAARQMGISVEAAAEVEENKRIRREKLKENK